ncbi:MAG: hypothetical protein AB1696_00450 [Planctomycetota bacterium]
MTTEHDENEVAVPKADAKPPAVRVRCRRCGGVYDPDATRWRCPLCNHSRISLRFEYRAFSVVLLVYLLSGGPMRFPFWTMISVAPFFRGVPRWPPAPLWVDYRDVTVSLLFVLLFVLIAATVSKTLRERAPWQRTKLRRRIWGILVFDRLVYTFDRLTLVALMISTGSSGRNFAFCHAFAIKPQDVLLVGMMGYWIWLYLRSRKCSV